jgi:hypothetical protein
VPGPRDVAVISSDVVLDTDARVAGVVVRRSGALSYLRGRSVTLESSGNVVVQGRLSMRPKSSSIVHRLVFVNVDESRFQGEGMKVLDSDVGLWVMDNGVLDIAGSSKRAWTRTVSGVRKGVTTIELRDPPKGWRVGDRIVLTPTRSPHPGWEHHTSFDRARIRAINGNKVKLSRPTKFGHPKVEVRPGVVFTPEVLNLTRNVRIQGTRVGRAHVFVNSSRRQRISHAQITHMGPRQKKSKSYTEPVTGRYPLHFHFCGKGSKGSVVKGTVVTRSGNRAFVPHESDGITFRDCISHDTMDGAYWWDPPTDDHGRNGPRHRDHRNESNNIVWERCVASLVRKEDEDPATRMNGFLLGAGIDNVVRECVAVGVQRSFNSSGYLWPEWAGNTWDFRDNVSHNNVSHGVYNWTNRRQILFTKGLVAFHNGKTGITHGAYLSPHLYKDVILYGNPEAAIRLYALSNLENPVRFLNAYCDGAGLSDYGLVTAGHRFPAKTPIRFERSTFRGFRKAAVHVIDSKNGTPDLIDFVDCTFKGNEFWLGSQVAPKTRLRVRDAAHGKLTLRRIDQRGAHRPRWNASVTRG